MSKYILKKRIFAIVFIVVVFGFSAVNLYHGYEKIGGSCSEVLLDGSITQQDMTQLENSITENFCGRMNFVETYAYIQSLLDKRECNNFTYIKDEQGFLHYASFYREEDSNLFKYAMRVKRLQDYAESAGTKVLFVVPPGKYNKDYTRFRTGMPVNDPNWIVDEMMFNLNRLGVETLDLRENLPNEEITYEETFFRTDHHWTIPAAFEASCAIVDKIEESFGEDLDPDNYYTDLANYDMVTYRSGMLGSMGRRTGANFCGIEDFTALWPHFEGQFTRECMTESGRTNRKKGSFQEVLMETSVLTERTDIYSDSQYSLYLNGLRIYEKIINDEDPEGTKIFFIRDSYFSPVMAFLMPMCGEIDAIWSLEESHDLDIESYIKNNEFDYIIVEVYPYNLNEEAFNYFKKED